MGVKKKEQNTKKSSGDQAGGEYAPCIFAIFAKYLVHIFALFGHFVGFLAFSI